MPRMDDSNEHFLRGLDRGMQRGNDLWKPRVVYASAISLVFGIMLGIIGYIEIINAFYPNR